MIMQEIDWRIDPLYAVVVGIDAGLAQIVSRIDNEDGFDGITAREHAEWLLGLGFVAAQAYVLGTWTDLNKIRTSRGKAQISKRECYKCDPIKLRGLATRIEVINAIANYFKHHDEWLSWPVSCTTEVLNSVGITQVTELPCVEATEIFCGRGWEFVVVHEVVKEWRAHVLDHLG
jgi:hypothetical protein